MTFDGKRIYFTVFKKQFHSIRFINVNFRKISENKRMFMCHSARNYLGNYHHYTRKIVKIWVHTRICMYVLSTSERSRSSCHIKVLKGRNQGCQSNKLNPTQEKVKKFRYTFWSLCTWLWCSISYYYQLLFSLQCYVGMYEYVFVRVKFCNWILN